MLRVETVETLKSLSVSINKQIKCCHCELDLGVIKQISKIHNPLTFSLQTATEM